MKEITGGCTAAKGFKAAGVHCGIRKNKSKLDLALIAADTACAAAAVYTANAVKAAPLLVTRQHLEGGYARAILCNSGNANACNADGMATALRCCQSAAAALGLQPEDILPASTGVIGVPLPAQRIEAALPALASALASDGSDKAAEAILTTDTFAKSLAVSFELGGKTVVLGGIAKGSGMIHPNMGTLLAFLTTDCAITPALLQKALRLSVDKSYNCVSVDGDTSTNDMTVILASGQAGNPLIDAEGEAFDTFVRALHHVNLFLAKEIARDGEGATKLLTCRVTGARNEQDARKLAKSVIASSLLKAAMFGADANWGRVMCALGYAGVSFDPMQTDISFSSEAGTLAVCQSGCGVPFDEALALKILSEKQILISVTLYAGMGGGAGGGEAEAYGCDLTYDYVKINGEYRS